MQKIAYLLVFNGLADWEPAHILCELRKSGQYEVKTAGFSLDPITTMGGVTILPDVTLEEIEAVDTAVFILPGGHMWEQQSNESLQALLRDLHVQAVPLAAICGATLEIARAGLTHQVRHTSNILEYLQGLVPAYSDQDYYVNEFAVTDKNIVTANGLGSVEFAREIIKLLGVHNETDADAWYGMFKHGIYAPQVA
jgi:putative intracellular protease/amidase